MAKLKPYIALILFLHCASALENRIRRPLIGPPCIQGEEGACPVNAECISKAPYIIEYRCYCKMGYKTAEPEPPDAICYKIPTQIEDFCDTHVDCGNLEPNVECKEKKCTCKQGYEANDDGTQCLKNSTGLSEPCHFDIECSQNIPNSICIKESSHDLSPKNEGICACDNSSLPNADNTQCLQFAERLGVPDSCTDVGHCKNINNTICSEQKCQCASGFVQHEQQNDICLPKVNLNQECIQTSQCLTENSECSTTCQCKDDYEETETGRCIMPLALDQVCDNDNEVCQLGLGGDLAVCDPVLNKCACSSSAVRSANGTTCIERKLVNSPCETDEECNAGIVGESFCNEGTQRCECVAGSVSTADGLLCYSGSLRIQSGSMFYYLALILITLLVGKV